MNHCKSLEEKIHDSQGASESTTTDTDQFEGEPGPQAGMKKTVSFEHIERAQDGKSQMEVQTDLLEPAMHGVDVEVTSSFESFEESPQIFGGSDHSDVGSDVEEELMGELDSRSDTDDPNAMSSGLSSAASGRTESSASGREKASSSLTTKGDPAHIIMQNNTANPDCAYPSNSPSMSRHDLAEPDSYSISTISTCNTLQSYTSSQLDNSFYFGFEDGREPALVDVEELQSRDAYGFLITENHDDEKQDNPRARIHYEKRVQKWRDMMYGSQSIFQMSLQEQYDNWQEVVKHRKLKARIRKGIPSEFRREVWVYISGSRNLRVQNLGVYEDTRNSGKLSGFETQIWKDIARTYRQHIDFKAENSALQQSLFNVLNSYALYNDEVGYCQGMNSVAALMLMYMEEVDVFWVLESLTNDLMKYSMQGVWHPSMPLINLRFFQFEHLVRYFLPKVANHLEENDIISCSQYQASQWFITGFLATKIPTPLLMRMWDIYLNEGIKALFRFGLAIMMHFKQKILESDMETILTTLGNEVSTLTDNFITQAMNIRISRSMLVVAENEFYKHRARNHGNLL